MNYVIRFKSYFKEKKEDFIIINDEIRGKILTFAEQNNTKENNPEFNNKLVKLIEILGDGNSRLSNKLLLFLIEITSKKEGNEGVSGGSKKKSKRTKKKSKFCERESRQTTNRQKQSHYHSISKYAKTIECNYPRA